MKTQSTASVFVLPRLLLALGLAGAVAIQSGCVLAAAGAGAGAVAYVRGELEANLDKDYGRVVDATRNALKDLEFARVSENKDALKAVMISRTALDKKVEVIVANTGNKLTSIKIRVGVFGDEQLSMAILEKIKANL